jgi:hypothetical protein
MRLEDDRAQRYQSGAGGEFHWFCILSGQGKPMKRNFACAPHWIDW